MHVPLSVQHRWYTSVLLGHYGYYGRPQNFPALHAFRQEMIRIWLTCLRRRSQKSRRMSWQMFGAVLDRFPLPTPVSLTPGRSAQHDASYPWEEPGAGNLHARICEGESQMAELLDQCLLINAGGLVATPAYAQLFEKGASWRLITLPFSIRRSYLVRNALQLR
jgi:hypothetical protein